MKLRYLTVLFITACCLLTSGCATVLTVAYPSIDETKKGDVKAGEKVGYHYMMSEDKGNLLLQKQPLCTQEVKVIKIKRKQLHGVIPAMVEVPFFGLGIADLVIAGTFAKATIEETDGGYVRGTDVMICGDLVFAPDEDVIIQFPVNTEVRHVKTDAKGMVPMNGIYPIPKGETCFNVFVNEKGGPTYVKTFEKNSMK